MWTDSYCQTRQCWDEKNWQKKKEAPVAYWMYKSEYDKEFGESILGMVNTNLCHYQTPIVFYILYTLYLRV